MALSQPSKYQLAAAILVTNLLLANIILWAVSLFKCRRRGDPARRGLRWMKLCGPILGLYLLCFALTCILQILFVEIGSDLSSDVEDYEHFLPASRFLAVFTDFFVALTSAVLFVTLTHFGLGILHAASSEPSKLQGPALLAAKAATGVLGVLTIAVLGLSLNFQKDVIAYQNDKGKLERFQDVTAEELDSEALTIRRLSGALKILLLVVAVASVAFSVLVFLRVSKTAAHLKKAALMLFAATILYFVRNLFSVVIMGMYFDFGDLASSLDVPAYLNILNFVFEATPLVLLLFVLSFLAQLKKGGLWSGASAYGQPAPQQFPQKPPQGYVNGMGPQAQQPPQGYMSGTGFQGQQPSYAGQAYQYGPQ